MFGILPFLSIFGYVLLIRRVFRWPVEAAPFFIVCLIIVVNYFAALLGVLKPVNLMMVYGGFISLVASPLYLPKNWQQIREKYFTPGLVLFIVSISILGVMAETLVVHIDWDTFIRWLPYAKYIYMQHELLNPNYINIDITYPPGAALFYYFMLSFSNYSESVISFAQLFFIITPLIILLRRAIWSEFWDAFIFYGLLLLLLSFFFNVEIGLQGSVMMDTPEGVFFGGILASYFILDQKSIRWLYLLPPMMAFILLKPMVLPFVLVSSVIIIADQVLIRKQEGKKISGGLIYIGLLIFPVLTIRSWTHYLKQFALTQTRGVKAIISVIKNPVSTLTSTQFHFVIDKYLRTLIHPLAFIIMMLVFAVFIYRNVNSNSKARILSANVWLGLGFSAFLILLPFYYLYFVQPNLALELNSFNRFANIFYLGWFIFMLAQAFYLIEIPALTLFAKKIPEKIKYLMIVIVCLILVFDSIAYIHRHQVRFEQANSTEYDRYAMDKIAVPAKSLIPRNSKIELVWNADLSVRPYIVNYELMPRHTQIFAVTKLINQMSDADFVKQLGEFNYLIVGDVNPAFWHNYKKLFTDNKSVALTQIRLCEGQKKAVCQPKMVPVYLYKITKEDGKLRLVNVTTI